MENQVIHSPFELDEPTNTENESPFSAIHSGIHDSPRELAGFNSVYLYLSRHLLTMKIYNLLRIIIIIF